MAAFCFGRRTCCWSPIVGVRYAGLGECYRSRRSLLAILLDTSPHAVGGNSEGADDVDLSAGSLTDQLGSEHAKGPPVVLGVMKDGSNATEVGPLMILLGGADAITDDSGTVGAERQ